MRVTCLSHGRCAPSSFHRRGWAVLTVGKYTRMLGAPLVDKRLRFLSCGSTDFYCGSDELVYLRTRIVFITA